MKITEEGKCKRKQEMRGTVKTHTKKLTTAIPRSTRLYLIPKTVVRMADKQQSAVKANMRTASCK